MPWTLAHRLAERVQHLSEVIGERHWQRPEALERASRYLHEQLSAMGVAVLEHPFEVRGQRFVNLEVVARGARRAGPERDCVVVGAHYDTVPGTPGADDNASGVAALLEMVSAIGREQLERPLRFVFFPNEEPPFFPDAGMGSAAYAAALKHEGVGVHVMLALEMLGYYSDAPGSQQYPPGLSPFYPDRGNFIAFVSNLRSRKRLAAVKRAFQESSPFACESLAAPEWTVVVGLSDHRSFWAQGYPALMVTDTAFMRNPHYHRSTDRAHTLDYARFAEVTHGLIGAVRRLANQP